ncbi:hypothetical protein NQ314_009873 [Rhamnusium bicolor]|uniref:DUF4746 domain-containing protein n=1 Tax=Rhamnusium bicolor TaxID=1586634 RepID=A0AAV8XWL1_9CUCU|nr:hypothetical protein NQ314_009873 [Rhamnusium bicolor]
MPFSTGWISPKCDNDPYLFQHGKMVNLLFGANVPKLTRILIEEIRKENMAHSGQKERDFMMEITDLTEEEQVRADAEEAIRLAAKAKEDAKKAKELLERRTLECQNMLNALSPIGNVIIFPNARTKYQEVLADLIQEAGVIIQQTEKVHISKEKLDELLYFAEEDELDELSIEILLSEEILFLLIKPEHGKEIENITDTLLTIVYGHSKQQPGDEGSAAQLLFEIKVDEETGDVSELRGIWTPPNQFVRAVTIKLFFSRFVLDFIIPEPGPTPDYLTVIFDHLKTSDAIQIMNQYPKEIMQYGFFTHDIPEEAEVVAKSIRKLEKCEQRTFKEKLVMQVSKKRSECILAFAQLGPAYISPNPKEGKRECEIFFPDDYESEEEVEEEGEGEDEATDEITQTGTQVEDYVPEVVAEVEAEGEVITAEEGDVVGVEGEPEAAEPAE